MQSLIKLKDTIFNIRSDVEFERAALSVFSAQAKHNRVYAEFIEQLGVDPLKVDRISKIPFLPISFFKTHQISSGNLKPEIEFTSSGTTGQIPSRHSVCDLEIYRHSFTQSFNLFYGNPKDYCILALLPAYLERQGSSLVYMANDLIENSDHPKSGFYLNNLLELESVLNTLAKKNTPTILLGVSFALLDLAEQLSANFTHKNLIVMETGGMKGRRKEMIRSEMHAVLKRAFKVQSIHSEYGMTELLSQAYSKGEGFYRTPPWMKVLVRETADPLSLTGHEKTGGLNIIDLANIYSCSFLATEDLGRTHADKTFEVLGRFDTAEIRGCNLMVG